MDKAVVGILMGSDSDLEVMNKGAKILVDFNVTYDMRIISAHRTPHDLEQFVSGAKDRGIKVIIAGAGLAAHLPGVTAAFTTLPVIGVPLKSGALAGVDALYSIVQMPSGVPVATVGIDNSKNAALLAIQMLALSDDGLATKLVEYKEEMKAVARAKNEALNR